MIRSRSVATLVVAGIALVIAAYVALWYFEANRVRAGIARFIEARAAHGMVVKSERLEIEGFPFRLDADFGRLTVDGLPYAKSAHIEAPSLIARARPWDPGSWRFVATKGFTADLGMGEAGITAISASDARGRAETELGDPGALEVQIDCHEVAFGSGAGVPSAHHASLRLTVPEKPPEDHTTPSLTFAAVVDRAVLPGGIEPKDGLLDSLTITGVVEGPVPEQPLAAALNAWRESGGSVELRQVALRWGEIDLLGDGTLTLDANLQPAAAFTGRIRGWGALLDDFVQAGTLTKEQASYYQLGLGLLTRVADDGQKELRAPITLQNTQVFLGPAKIANVPLITWQ